METPVIDLCMAVMGDPELCAKLGKLGTLSNKLEQIAKQYELATTQINLLDDEVGRLLLQLSSSKGLGNRERERLEQQLADARQLISEQVDKVERLDEQMMSMFQKFRAPLDPELWNLLNNYIAERRTRYLGFEDTAFFFSSIDDDQQEQFDSGVDNISELLVLASENTAQYKSQFSGGSKEPKTTENGIEFYEDDWKKVTAMQNQYLQIAEEITNKLESGLVYLKPE